RRSVNAHDESSVHGRVIGAHTRRLLAAGLTVSLAATLRPQTIAAQSVRPSSGLFGTRETDAKRTSLIDFTMSTSDGYDTGDNESAADSPNLRRNGPYSNLDTALRYTWARHTRQLTATA